MTLNLAQVEAHPLCCSWKTNQPSNWTLLLSLCECLTMSFPCKLQYHYHLSFKVSHSPHLCTICWELEAASFLSPQLSLLHQKMDHQVTCQSMEPGSLHTFQFLVRIKIKKEHNLHSTVLLTKSPSTYSYCLTLLKLMISELDFQWWSTLRGFSPFWMVSILENWFPKRKGWSKQEANQQILWEEVIKGNHGKLNISGFQILRG